MSRLGFLRRSQSQQQRPVSSLLAYRPRASAKRRQSLRCGQNYIRRHGVVILQFSEGKERSRPRNSPCLCLFKLIKDVNKIRWRFRFELCANKKARLCIWAVRQSARYAGTLPDTDPATPLTSHDVADLAKQYSTLPILDFVLTVPSCHFGSLRPDTDPHTRCLALIFASSTPAQLCI